MHWSRVSRLQVHSTICMQVFLYLSHLCYAFPTLILFFLFSSFRFCSHQVQVLGSHIFCSFSGKQFLWIHILQFKFCCHHIYTRWQLAVLTLERRLQRQSFRTFLLLLSVFLACIVDAFTKLYARKCEKEKHFHCSAFSAILQVYSSWKTKWHDYGCTLAHCIMDAIFTFGNGHAEKVVLRNWKKRNVFLQSEQ